MKMEDIKIGDYVAVAGGIRCVCVKHDFVDSTDRCKFCAFEGTERCMHLSCDSTRADRESVIFIVKLNPNCVTDED